MRNMEPARIPLILATTLAVALGGAACSGEPQPDGSAVGTSATPESPSGSGSAAPTPTCHARDNDPATVQGFRFDALCGGSPVIQVYPGVGMSEADRQYNATYNDGDIRPADCHTTGRKVSSHTGELTRESDSWVKLKTPAGQLPQYATETYGHMTPGAPQLPDCPPGTPGLAPARQ
jgi:hypothetical protein